MGFRFQKRIRIFKGLTLNLSNSGTSLTVGGRGASINARRDKVTGNAGIPGAGISYRQRLDHASTEPSANKTGGGIGAVVLTLILLAVVGVIFSH